MKRHTYAYNAASELTSYTGPEGTLNYTHDATSQLTNVSGARAETYTYDVNGNRTLTGYVTTAGNRLQSDGVFNYTYDNEGNVLTKTKISNGELYEYTWDHRNRLTKVVVKNSGGTVIKEDRFTYDVLDRRIGKWYDADGAGPGTPTQTWHLYDGRNAYADFNGAGSLTSRYLHGRAVDELFAQMDSANNTTWYLTDMLGSVRQIAQTNGTILNTVTYDSYGNILSETGTGDRFKFTGQDWDSEIGQYHYDTRPYLPGPGRFGSEDWIDFEGGTPNLYEYVGNTPHSYTDPHGLFSSGMQAYSPPPPDRSRPYHIFNQPSDAQPSLVGPEPTGLEPLTPLAINDTGGVGVDLRIEQKPPKILPGRYRVSIAITRAGKYGHGWILYEELDDYGNLTGKKYSAGNFPEIEGYTARDGVAWNRDVNRGQIDAMRSVELINPRIYNDDELVEGWKGYDLLKFSCYTYAHHVWYYYTGENLLGVDPHSIPRRTIPIHAAEMIRVIKDLNGWGPPRLPRPPREDA